jgi:hypothetical protein
MIRCQVGTVALALGLLSPAFAADVFKSTTPGDPGIKSIDVIAFGPKGALLVGDGKASQVVAIDTGDTTAKPWTAAAIEKIDDKIAGMMGLDAKGIEIAHLAVNPASGTAYLAVRRQSDKTGLIFTIDGTGKIALYELKDVKHVRLPLPKGEKAAPHKVTDLAWAGDRILAAAAANEEFASKVYSVPAPLGTDAKASVFSTETFHVAHGRWETRAPMSAILPYEENGKKYVVGAFACTPLVKYPIDDLQSGAQVKGTSVVELGSGNQPQHMFTYEKDGKSYLLMNTLRFHHKQRPISPSAYWTARVDLSLLGEKEKINQLAQWRIDKASFKPITDRIQMVESFHGVVRMDKLDKTRALVLKEGGSGGLTLTALALP